MTKSYIVIGANYGDEGKGLMTDYLARTHKASDVTRFNGGSQAGHTVVSDLGRNVFNMLSSGTAAGAVTRLAQTAIVNPLAIDRERLALDVRGYKPKKLLINPKCRVTTPFEVWLNQAVETARGAARHGSCGLGIGETVERNKHIELTVSDLWGTIGAIVKKLNRIAKEYVPVRAKRLGIEMTLSNAEVQLSIDHFMQDVIGLLDQGMANTGEDMFKAYFAKLSDAPMIYEGAQGLALDQHLGVFPHVTRSNTGIINALRDLQAREYRQGYNGSEVEVVYCTRTYLTRHGAGPLAEFKPDTLLCGGKVVDETNVPNEWQGTLRFAALHLPALGRRISADLGTAFTHPLIKPTYIKPVIALTCMDQSEEVLIVRRDDESPVPVKVADLPELIAAVTGIHVKYVSHGPSAADVKETFPEGPQRHLGFARD